MSAFKKKSDILLSYIFPIIVEKTSSEYNPVLEVALINGKYSLNSENANYSNATLYTTFDLLFKRLKPKPESLKTVLILGYGAGSVDEIIRKYNPDSIIDGVEIDSKVLELAKKYFRLEETKNVNLHCIDAVQYMKDCNKKYDMIVIDLYIDTIVPKESETEEFLNHLKNALNIEGSVIFNKVAFTKANKEEIPRLHALYQKVFHNLTIETIMQTGKIFISKKLNEA